MLYIFHRNLEKFDLPSITLQKPSLLNSFCSMKFAIVTGGWSHEKDENIHAAQDVARSLGDYHEVQRFTFLPDFPADQNKEIILSLERFNPDFVFLCTTEELPIQGVLDFLSFPYSGSNVLTTALSLDKDKCKRLFECANIATPDWKTLERGAIEKFVPSEFPVIIKPNSSGSSCGVRLVKNITEVAPAVEYAFQFSSKVLVEQYIEGREITVPMVHDLILPPVEITRTSGKDIFDYDSKINILDNVEYTIAEVDVEILHRIKDTMQKLKDVFSIKSVFRADFILEGNKLFLLEFNTLPCLANGMMGVSARGYGWTYYQFLMNIVDISFSQKL